MCSKEGPTEKPREPMVQIAQRIRRERKLRPGPSDSHVVQELSLTMHGFGIRRGQTVIRWATENTLG